MGESADADPIAVSVGDHTYELAFSAGGLRRVESASGKTFGELAAAVERQSFQGVAWLLRAALWRTHPKATDAELDAIVDEYGIAGLAGTEAEPGPLLRAMQRDLAKGSGAGNPT